MTKSKNLPGVHIRFAHATSTGHFQNQYGNGKMDLSLHRPHSPYPWLDLGLIYYSAPTAEQLKAIEKVCEEDPYGPEAHNRSDVHRRLSFKQAEYVNYLILEMLTEKFGKDGIPCDDEIDEIMTQVREGNYPVNRAKREEERKWQLTEKENELLGKLRYECQLKRVEIDMEFDYQIDMSSNKCGNIYLLHYNDINKHFQFTRTESLSKTLFDAIQYVSAIKSEE